MKNSFILRFNFYGSRGGAEGRRGEEGRGEGAWERKRKTKGRERLHFARRHGIIAGMEREFIKALDEYFCAHYSDYVRLSAIEGYRMPEVVYVGADGNIARHDPACMRLCRQENAAGLLARFKDELADTGFTFSFAVRSLRDKLRDVRDKHTFAKLLPAVLAHVSETAEGAGKLLSVEPRFWQMIVKGKVYPEKNTVLALALACRLQLKDVQLLLAACGFEFCDDNVRDVVVRYLLEQQIFNPAMRDACLQEYKVSLPL